jgi:hypothetical protein
MNKIVFTDRLRIDFTAGDTQGKCKDYPNLRFIRDAKGNISYEPIDEDQHTRQIAACGGQREQRQVAQVGERRAEILGLL